MSKTVALASRKQSRAYDTLVAASVDARLQRGYSRRHALICSTVGITVSVHGVVAFEFVGHHPSRLTALGLSISGGKKRTAACLIATTLHQNINRAIAVLIDRTPQILFVPLEW